MKEPFGDQVLNGEYAEKVKGKVSVDYDLNKKEVINKMEETENILDKKVGDNDVPKNTVSPAKVKISHVTIKTKDKEGKEMSTPLAEFHVKHPEKEELIKITKVKFDDSDNLRAVGFWVQTDDAGDFYKGSSVDIILKFLECKTLKETEGKEIDTVEESKSSAYLCLKAY